MIWKVETQMLSGWENCWADENGSPVFYETYHEAHAAIDEHLQDVSDAVAAGDMEEEYDPNDYRIVEINPS